MARTLRFGSNAAPRLTSRIDRFVVRRHTSVGYDRLAELALADHARQVALEVTPHLTGKPLVTFAANAPRFGKRS